MKLQRDLSPSYHIALGTRDRCLERTGNPNWTVLSLGIWEIREAEREIKCFMWLNLCTNIENCWPSHFQYPDHKI